jgi:Kef-type K+ transport system membrane component KefB
MRKEYIPAIILYIAAALLFVAAAVCLVIEHYTWATWLLIGIAIMLFASSKLVQIGNKLREDEENKGQKEETENDKYE